MVDGKITPLGKILRKTGIDELPQLINIIKGDLNFVGPRPLTQADVDRLGWTSDFYDFRWKTKPGLTGLAQLSPICHKKMSLFWDKYYISNQSLALDIRVVLGSALIPIIGKYNMKALIYSDS